VVSGYALREIPSSGASAMAPTQWLAGLSLEKGKNTTWKVIREIWGAQKVLFFEINRLWKRP
jgi:hypothetical protein